MFTGNIANGRSGISNGSRLFNIKGTLQVTPEGITGTLGEVGKLSTDDQNSGNGMDIKLTRMNK